MVVPSKTNKDCICTASFHLFFLFILVNFVTSTARNDDTFTPYCSGGHETTPNSVFQRNLKTLFSYLSSNATANKEFYNATVTDINNSNTVYGLFMCNGDVPAHLCSQCVLHATSYNLSSYPYSDCSLPKEVTIRNDDCMVRYSNNSFFSTGDFSIHSGSCSPVISVSNQAIVKHLVSETLNGVADEAANSLIGVKNYATKEVRVSEFQTLYFQAQCMPNLTPQDCRKCLNATITNYVQNCGSETNTAPIILGSSESYSCYIRNDVYPFYRPSNAPYPQELIPGSNTIDSKYSQQPSYLSHNCSNNDTLNYDYQSHLKTLFSSMSLNAIKTIFFNMTVDTVHGLFMCRGDISLSPTLCQLCVQDATKRILSECPSSKEAVIWYDKCLLRYSYHSLISDINTAAPKFHQFNMRNNSRFNMLQSFTTWKLADILSELSHLKTGNSNIKNYETRSVKLNDRQTIYTLAQCTPDLSDKTCGHCLRTIFENEIPWNSLARPEGRILYQSCYMMFGLSQFYNNGDEPEELGQVNPPPTKENEKRKSRTIIIVVLTTLSTFLLTLSCYLLRKRARKSSYKTLILKKNFGLESTTLKGLQFEMTEIKTATNNFSHENKIGEGGFGQVYKGILSDGRQVAVKRLSSSSNQGIVEFKNEILLIAKLQQRNLVALIGFCLEDQEKILIYEYVPNGSLDSFLFDIQQQCLSWNARYKIIGGTALGILYLHEYSRLKVIHRDLKPSNVLLDENMNPKISDFGMARMVQINQDGGQTNKIAGTWGYMSPEYAMFGQFSEKSDVFSFGVIVLEIITGKRNVSPYDPHHVAEGLTSYVWRQWINETPLTILDSKIENYSLIEVLKCIQIGLLCIQENPNVRPTMSIVVSYLNSHSPELPSPQEPAFFIHSRMNQEITSQMKSRSANNFVSYSVNEMSISEFYPRQ